MSAPRPRILCVDDEQHVLDGLSRVLRREYEVEVARGGGPALYRLAEKPLFAVIMSDMRMPGINGTMVLKAAREQMPDATRLLLTGQAEVKDAIGAVNEGQIFRYLTKPCKPSDLEVALRHAVEQHDLRISQRQLLEETLTGSMRGLVELLAMANPDAFGRAGRARQLIVALARLIGFRDVWQMELAAMLSQVGMLTLAPELLRRLADGASLTAEEERIVERMPRAALRVLGDIPRVDEVRDILAALDLRFVPEDESSPSGETIPLGARLLRVVLDYDRLTSRGLGPADAVAELRRREGHYDPAVLTDLATVLAREPAAEHYVAMRLRDVQVGMTFVADVRMPDGTLLIARQQQVTEALLDRIQSFWAGMDFLDPVRVVPPAQES
jgi:response regulator RpfG family c-di-GMP phosphodiesterase